MASHVSIILTGSRNATDEDAIFGALDEALTMHTYCGLSLFVGDAKGADSIAREWWHNRNHEHVLTSPAPMVELFTEVVDVEARRGGVDDGVRERLYLFRADWSQHGKAAGPRRNSEMVKWWHEDAGPHHALAIWNGYVGGSGTLDCMSKIAKLGHHISVVPC